MIDILSLEEREIMKGFKGRFIHTKYMTIAFWVIKKGSVLPSHSHPHEQTTQVLEGKFELVVEDEKKICEKGFLTIIPPYTIHSGVALTDCKIVDVFSPVREDYK